MTSDTQKLLIRWLLVLGCALSILVLPRPEGVSNEAWTLLAIFAATIVGSIVQPLNGAAMVLLGVVALALFRAVPIEKALSGYSDKFVWLVLAAFFISRAMIKTGLGHRIALIFVRLIGRRTLGWATRSSLRTSFSHRSFRPPERDRAASFCPSHAA